MSDGMNHENGKPAGPVAVQSAGHEIAMPGSDHGSHPDEQASADLYDAPPTPQASVETDGMNLPGSTQTGSSGDAMHGADKPAEAADSVADRNVPPAHPDGFPDLNSYRPRGMGRRWLAMLAFVAIALGGIVWSVHRVIAQHQAEVKHERDAAAEHPAGGRAFDQTPPAGASTPAANAPGAASSAGAPVQPVGQGTTNGGAVNVQPTGRPVDGMTPQRPAVSWYDGDLMIGAGGSVPDGAAGTSQGQSASAGATVGATGGAASNPLSAALTPTTLRAVQANRFANRDLLLSAGAKISCAGDTAFDSTLAGVSTCTVTSNVYSDTGHVLLIERGSEINTEFRSAPSQGQRRVFILSARIKTPNGVVTQIDSPAADALGRMGIDGDVDNHWGERIGAALLLSLIQDSIGYLASKSGSSNGTVVFQNTQQTGNDMAGKVLNSTINIAPTISKNQGSDFLIVLARDIDFSSVYQLEAK